VDERESDFAGDADANIAGEFGDIEDFDVKNVAGPDRNICDRRLPQTRELMNSLVGLLSRFIAGLGVNSL
jgi:hypothetical protein